MAAAFRTATNTPITSVVMASTRVVANFSKESRALTPDSILLCLYLRGKRGVYEWQKIVLRELFQRGCRTLSRQGEAMSSRIYMPFSGVMVAISASFGFADTVTYRIVEGSTPILPYLANPGGTVLLCESGDMVLTQLARQRGV
jgi:hypothetical protein